jgi:hypothetical protein
MKSINRAARHDRKINQRTWSSVPTRATQTACHPANRAHAAGLCLTLRDRRELIRRTGSWRSSDWWRTRARSVGSSINTVFLGAAAAVETVKAEAGNYDILHFATHGILNDRSPLYSHILLAQADAAKSEAQPKEDGLLEAWEIMQMDLRADLAVLSACETARGRVGAGEGVIGLTWAFFVAGAPTTVVSQWKVRADSTAALMVEFHRLLQIGRPPEQSMEEQTASLRLDPLLLPVVEATDEVAARERLEDLFALVSPSVKKIVSGSDTPDDDDQESLRQIIQVLWKLRADPQGHAIGDLQRYVRALARRTPGLSRAQRIPSATTSVESAPGF